MKFGCSFKFFGGYRQQSFVELLIRLYACSPPSSGLPLPSGIPSTVESLLGFYPLYLPTYRPSTHIPFRWNEYIGLVIFFLPTYRSDGTNTIELLFSTHISFCYPHTVPLPTYRSAGTNTIELLFFTYIPFRWNEYIGLWFFFHPHAVPMERKNGGYFLLTRFLFNGKWHCVFSTYLWYEYNGGYQVCVFDAYISCNETKLGFTLFFLIAATKR